jgi:hypothetical protein
VERFARFFLSNRKKGKKSWIVERQRERESMCERQSIVERER